MGICYHYCTKAAARKIVAMCVIRSSSFPLGGMSEQFVWLSTRRDFEPSVASKPEGLVRFAFVATGMLTFAEVQRRNLTDYQAYLAVAMARDQGADPEKDWLAYEGQLIVADNVICIEEWQTDIDGERDGWRIIDERSLTEEIEEPEGENVAAQMTEVLPS